MSRRGIFISFEGVDGCGKSTQIKELRRRLRRLGDRLVLTREPGGTVLGEDVRRILQQADDRREITDKAELLLFAASRTELVSEVISPAIATGKIVIADRFLDSTTIYQGVARGLPTEMVETINGIAVGDCLPDITFLMDIDPSDSRRRMTTRGNADLDRIEKMPEAFFHQVRQGYLDLAKKEPNRFVIIDAMEKVSTIADRIWATLTERYDGLLD